MAEVLSAIKIISDYHALSETQQREFRAVTMEGLKGKFYQTLRDDTDSMLGIVEVWIKYGFLPMDETFCAVDEASGKVLAILLLNNFKKPNALSSLLCLLNVAAIIGLRRTLKIAFHFLAIDNFNKEIPSNDVVAEIYLVSTREDQRGSGIGTLLMNGVIETLRESRKSAPGTGGLHKVKLLVFAKNPARRLYERLAFEQVGIYDTPKIEKAFGEAYDALICMERPL